jgi:hypothetical protein
MARSNPETTLTRWFRIELERRGGYVLKCSDSFTRGVPDVSLTSDRVTWIEMKVADSSRRVEVGDERSWQALTVRGAQDHFIRQVCRRCYRGACVVTGPPEEWPSRLALWLPVDPSVESNDPKSVGSMYLCAAVGDGVFRWLGL